MYALLTYSLKVAACLAVFYLFFKLLLSRETLHRFNRFVVLTGMALAFALPLCVVTVYRELPQLPLPDLQEEPAPALPLPEEEAAYDWLLPLGILYSLGAAGMVLRLFCSFFAIFRIIGSGSRRRLDDGSVLVQVAGPVAPFSWGRYIVISEEDMALSGREILLHEQAHLRLRHSADLLVTDLAGCLQWFNPAMWLLRRELRAIHEYEADRAVIESGADARDYQLLLIRKAVGGRWYSVANSFNHSKLKNRITMMLRKRSSRWAGVKALFVLPLAAAALGAFAQTAYVVPADKVNKESATNNTPEESTSQKNAPLYLVDGQEVASIEGIESERIASIDIFKDPEKLASYGDKARNGVVDIKLKKPEQLAGEVAKIEFSAGSTVIVDGGTPARSEGKPVIRIEKMQSGEQEKQLQKLESIEKYFQSDEWKAAQQQMNEATDFFQSDEWEAAMQRLTEAGVQIAATLEQAEVESPDEVTNATAPSDDSAWHLGDESEMHARGRITFSGSGKVPDNCLIFINGKRASKEELARIPSGRIRRMSIYKGKKAVEKFGPEALDGVIDVKARKR